MPTMNTGRSDTFASICVRRLHSRSLERMIRLTARVRCCPSYSLGQWVLALYGVLLLRRHPLARRSA